MFHQRRAVSLGRFCFGFGKIQDGGMFFLKRIPFQNRFLRRNKGRYTSQTDNSTQLRQISSFYSQLEVAVDTLEAKYTSSVSRDKDREIQQLLPNQGMVLRMLTKIHDKIIRRLRSKPSLATPWRGNFTMDVPFEVFEVTLCHIIRSNNFGHRFEETPAYIKVSITDTRKAVFIFNKMNAACVIVSLAKLLKRSLGISDELERCEAVISEEKPLVLKYPKNNEVLSVYFCCGYWN